MFSVRMRCDSGTKPRPTWLTRNAGLSVHSTGSRVMRRPSAIMASVTHGAVLRPGIDLDQPHQRHGIEEVHAADALGVLAPGGDGRDRDRRGVGGEDGVRADELLEPGEQRLLGLELLDDRLDDDVGLADLGQILGDRDALDRGLGVAFGQRGPSRTRPSSVLAM